MIKVNMEDLVGCGFALGLLGLVAVPVVLAVRQEKKFKEHKEAVLSARKTSLDDDILECSIRNKELDVEKRVIAKRALESLKACIDISTTIPGFDKALQNFDTLYYELMDGDQDEKDAIVKYWEEQLAINKEDAEKKADRNLEAQKFKAIGDSLKALKTDVNLTVNN